MDDLKGDVRILDLCSGRGQDIGKQLDCFWRLAGSSSCPGRHFARCCARYSREHRACAVKSVVCVDFAIEAVEEARRRYRALSVERQEVP